MEKDGGEFAHAPMNKYIRKQIEALEDKLSRAEIAERAGYNNANMITRIERGEIRVPLDKVPALARALFVDPTYLIGLALEEIWPNEESLVGYLDLAPAQQGHAGDLADAQIIASEHQKGAYNRVEEKTIGASSTPMNLNFKVEPAFRKSFRIAAAKEGITMLKLLEIVFENYVRRSP